MLHTETELLNLSVEKISFLTFISNPEENTLVKYNKNEFLEKLNVKRHTKLKPKFLII